MSERLFGSICLTDLMDRAKQGHSAFSRAKNGKIYLNFTQWVNDEPDPFGNHASFQLSSKMDKKETEGKVYFGNAKKSEAPANEAPITAQSMPSLNDLPF